MCSPLKYDCGALDSCVVGQILELYLHEWGAGFYLQKVDLLFRSTPVKQVTLSTINVCLTPPGSRFGHFDFITPAALGMVSWTQMGSD